MMPSLLFAMSYSQSTIRALLPIYLMLHESEMFLNDIIRNCSFEEKLFFFLILNVGLASLEVFTLFVQRAGDQSMADQHLIQL